ncbi:MAG: inositol monophosphatase family protein [Alphaproteobacteria bacterium]|nr:inositol monophosphatase family protein [Alphaproteobacteria bacterium]
MDDCDLETMMRFAERLADAARAETLPRWRTGCAAADKNEGGAWDPVTEADREAERAMRRLIEAEFPDHGIQGEEFPEKKGKGRWSWSLDPVDGTRAFVCGLPSWTTLIALLDEGQPVLGVIDAAPLDERYVGPGGDRKTSGCTTLAEARLSTTDPYLFSAAETQAWDRVRQRVRTTRYGLDAYGYARVAAGSLDLVIEAGLKPHDYNALIPVVCAAGGAIGNWEGGEDFSGGRVIAAATPGLYRAALEAMRS